MTFHSSNPEVLTINNVGRNNSYEDFHHTLSLETHQLGEAIIYATYNDGEIENELLVKVTVKDSPVVTFDTVIEMLEIPYMTKTIEDTTMLIGEEKVVAEGKNGLDRRTWHVTYEDGEEVAKVISNYENVEEKQDKVVHIGIAKLIESITLSEKDITLNGGETYLLKPVIVSKNQIAISDVHWKSSEPKVATVDNFGNVIAHNVGTSEITAWVGPKSDTVKVTVVDILLKEIRLYSYFDKLDIGDKRLLQLNRFPHNTTNEEDAAWTSSDYDVVTVDEKGEVTAVGAGTAIITATIGDVSGKIELEVESYTDYPVYHAWDFGVWSHYKDGIKVASSFNDFAGKELTIIQESHTQDGHPWVKYQVDGKTIGWVSRTALKGFQPQYTVLYTDVPVEDAWNYGLWSEPKGGKKLKDFLYTYRGKKLDILEQRDGEQGTPFVKIRYQDYVIGWVSRDGLKSMQGVVDVYAFYDKPVAEAWNYGLWSHFNDGTKLAGSLNNFAGKTVQVVQKAKDKYGNPWAKIRYNYEDIGWVSAYGLVENNYLYPTYLYKAKPVADAWNFGLWSHYQNGYPSLRGSLHTFASEELFILEEAFDTNGQPWVKFMSEHESDFWVSKRGFFPDAASKPTAHYYSVLPVSDAWDYGIWSSPTNGKYVASLDMYARKHVQVMKEMQVGTNNIWAKISVNGNEIGWVSKRGLSVVNPNTFIHYSAKPVSNAWDYSVWSNHTNGSKVGGSLNDYAGKTLNIINVTTVNGVSWVQFEDQGHTIGWVAQQGLEK